MDTKKMLFLILFLLFNKSIYSEATKNDSTLAEIMQSKGVVYFKNDELIMDTVESLCLYNKDGSKFLRYSFVEPYFTVDGEKYLSDSIEFHMDILEKKHKFNPRFFKPNDGVIFQFECKEIDEEYFEVYINKEKNLTKYIKKSDSFFIFETWEKNIFRGYVNFGFSENPIHKKIGLTESILDYNSYDIMDLVFKAKKIEGEWMYVYSTYYWYNYKKKNNKYKGWIRWRDGMKVLIEIQFQPEVGKRKFIR